MTRARTGAVPVRALMFPNSNTPRQTPWLLRPN